MAGLFRRLTAFVVAFLLVSGVWCGGVTGDAFAMPVEMRSKSVPECAQHDMTPENKGSQGSTVPCVFRSLDLLSDGGASSVQAGGIFNYGQFVPASFVDKIPFAMQFRVAGKSLDVRICPHSFYSVLNL
ncbi:MAG TPA: hypothetical protein VGL11_06330 [Candidatus Binatia bacterium]